MLTSELVAKIGDLGVAKMVQANSKQITNLNVLCHLRHSVVADNPVYDTATDVFSFQSVVLLYMCSVRNGLLLMVLR